jgi:gliding motility-associated-like protein
VNLEDKKLQELLSKKVGKMELPVDPSLWTGVQAGISSGGAATGAAGLSVAAKAVLVASAAVLVASLTFFAMRETPEEGNVADNTKVTEHLENPSESQELQPESEQMEAEEVIEAMPQLSEEEEEGVEQEKVRKQRKEVSTNVTSPKQEKEAVSAPKAVDLKTEERSNNDAVDPAVEYSQDITLGNEQEEEHSIFAEEERLSAEFSATGDLDDHYLFAFSPKNQNAESYHWEMGDGTSYNGPQVEHQYLDEGDYVVRLTTTNEQGQSSTEEMLLEVVEPSELFIPNVFTPNNDGMNARFDIAKASKNIEIITLRIFNQQQEMVFQNDERGNSWDGTDQFGNPCKAGTYRYWVKAQGNDGISYKRGGTVTLLR